MATHVADAQALILGRLAPGRQPLLSKDVPRLFGVEAQEEELRTRLRRAATTGESTSLIVCGYRGCGKHSLVARVLASLETDGVPAFDVAHLSGSVHADAAPAMRELVRQLAAPGTERRASRYVDDLALVSDELSRRRAEGGAPLLVVLSQLECFALQQRQTLLYVLLDAVQSKLGCIVVLGITTDRNVLEHFEKRVRSRLHNNQVTLGHAALDDVLAMLDDRLALDDSDYGKAFAAAWSKLKGEAAFRDSLETAVDLGRPMAWYTRVAALAVARLTPRQPVMTLDDWLDAVDAHLPMSSSSWLRAVNAMPPAHVALVLAYLRFERDDDADYNLERAQRALAKLRSVNATAVFFPDAVLLRAQAALLASSVVTTSTTSKAKVMADPSSLRLAPVRLTGALSLEDLWHALRTGDLEAPSVLRQWVLQDAA